MWFTKGMACPFCRTQMSQLARGYAQIKALGAEVLQVTPTRPERARFFAKNYGRYGLFCANASWLAGWTIAIARRVLDGKRPRSREKEALDIWTNFLDPFRETTARPGVR